MTYPSTKFNDEEVAAIEEIVTYALDEPKDDIVFLQDRIDKVFTYQGDLIRKAKEMSGQIEYLLQSVENLQGSVEALKVLAWQKMSPKAEENIHETNNVYQAQISALKVEIYTLQKRINKRWYWQTIFNVVVIAWIIFGLYIWVN